MTMPDEHADPARIAILNAIAANATDRPLAASQILELAEAYAAVMGKSVSR